MSDIFNEYAKIAESIGLVSSAEEDKPKESAKLKRYKKDSHPRLGSDDISTIEALYGNKPDDSVIKYENNIMEAAHPKPVVISPSYDRLNGLVENNIERNNIMCNIARKPNDGISNQKRYAQKELLMELVRVANDMDNQGYDDLRSIADTCIESLSEEKKNLKTAQVSDWLDAKKDWLEDHGRDIFQATKGMGTGALIGGVLGGILGAVFGEGAGAIPGFMMGSRLGGVAGGLIASIARTAPQVISISKNAQDAISQISDLAKKIPEDNRERSFLISFQKELENLINLSNGYNNIISSLKDNNSSSNQEDAQQAHSITDNLMDSIKSVEHFSELFTDRVNRKVYQSFLSNSKILTPVYNLISDDVEDVQDSIRSLSAAITNFKLTISDTAKQAKTTMEENKSSENEKPQETSFENIDEESEPEEQADEENNTSFTDIAKFLGHKPTFQEISFFKSLK